MVNQHLRNTQFASAMSVLLRLHHGGFPGATVAGGYVRDMLLGFAPKDMDVFIPKSQLSTVDLEAALSRALGTTITTQFDLSYGEDTEIDRVLTEVPVLNLPPIQIIEVTSGDPKERAAQHDFGIVQCWITLDGLDTTEAFLKDVLNKTATLVHCESQKEHGRSIRRWARWHAGNLGGDGYRLVDNTGFVG